MLDQNSLHSHSVDIIVENVIYYNKKAPKTGQGHRRNQKTATLEAKTCHPN